MVAEAGTHRGAFAIEAALRFPGLAVHTADVVARPMPDLPNLRFWHCDFEEMLTEVGAFDFAFIDSGPCEEEPSVRIRHWRAAKEWAADGGVVACHDMIHRDWEGAEEIASESLILGGGKGLALWQKCT